MTEQRPGAPVPFDAYNPKNWDEARMLVGPGIPVPEHTSLKEGQICVWKTVANKSYTTLISNLIHRDFRGTYCQAQISLVDNKYHVFMFHYGPRDLHMPEELVNQIFMEDMAPQILGELENHLASAN